MSLPEIPFEWPLPPVDPATLPEGFVVPEAARLGLRSDGWIVVWEELPGEFRIAVTMNPQMIKDSPAAASGILAHNLKRLRARVG